MDGPATGCEDAEVGGGGGGLADVGGGEEAGVGGGEVAAVDVEGYPIPEEKLVEDVAVSDSGLLPTVPATALLATCSIR